MKFYDKKNMKIKMKIETERLYITEFEKDMSEDVHKNSLDYDNRRFVPDEVFETVEDALKTIEFLRECYESGNGPFVYPAILKTGENIGYVQAVPMNDGKWEIGYHVGDKYTKKGYATEMVKAFIPIIMKQLQINTMIGVCLADNLASRKVIEKFGFKKGNPCVYLIMEGIKYVIMQYKSIYEKLEKLYFVLLLEK